MSIGWNSKVHVIVFNKLGFLLVSLLVSISGAIYASEDTDVLPLKQQLKDSTLCLAAAKDAGIEYGVDYDLLQTISSVESGVWNELRNTYVAWPWTVNVNGKGYYYETREEAVKAAKNFIAQGHKSIDVGCMQVNMKYHGDGFSSIDEAMDPVNNVKYSAKFLRSLYVRNGNDWIKAAKKYHSANSTEGAVYTARLAKRFESYKSAGLTQGVKLF